MRLFQLVILFGQLFHIHLAVRELPGQLASGGVELFQLYRIYQRYTLQKALHWLQRQVAPTIKMVQALDEENHTTILKDMIEQAELKDKHKHLLQLEKSTIEERIDTAVPQENDGIF